MINFRKLYFGFLIITCCTTSLLPSDSPVDLIKVARSRSSSPINSPQIKRALSEGIQNFEISLKNSKHPRCLNADEQKIQSLKTSEIVIDDDKIIIPKKELEELKFKLWSFSISNDSFVDQIDLHKCEIERLENRTSQLKKETDSLFIQKNKLQEELNLANGAILDYRSQLNQAIQLNDNYGVLVNNNNLINFALATQNEELQQHVAGLINQLNHKNQPKNYVITSPTTEVVTQEVGSNNFVCNAPSNNFTYDSGTI